MSMFSSPEDHAANGPETWRVVKVADRTWHVTTAEGVPMSYHTTKREAEAEIESGFTRRLYDQEARWYAGEPVSGWRPWAELAGAR